LTDYPTNLLTQALADTEIEFTVTPGGPTLAAFDIPDATPFSEPGASVAPTPVSEAPAATVAPSGAIPGGVSAGYLPSIFQTADLTPLVLLASILVAAALGAGHALTPGHGKTLMAAYLVGTRGSPLHAAALGLSVTLSHTLGILVLAALIVGAQGVLAPDVVVRAAPLVAAVAVATIGGWMLIVEARRRAASRTAAAAQARDHDHEHDHDSDNRVSHDGHLPPPSSTISWRSLFVLGLAGGLVPSTSALLILLGSIAAGRPAFGFVLVVAFGLGMALVMAGIGLALVLARGRLDRVDAASPLGRVSAYVPLAAALFVFGLGVVLTVQAVAGIATR
jgi:ABC-type nickel/cobalt efflux system permease component RcnA